MKNFFLTFLLFLTTLSFIIPAQAGERTVYHVITHNKAKIVTDTVKGFKPYPRWGTFPSSATQYRKAILTVTYQCPDSQHCGQWDYIDEINLRRVGGVNGSSKNYEIARLISPYGWQFDETWKFTWHVDITDFASLLHDSVEIEFNHDGYESATDRGWLVTLDFALTVGTPALECVGIDTLWNGIFPYGDSAKPIENYLRPASFTNTHNAQLARIRILQTGHGMDDSENCSEFCFKNRMVFVDDSLIGQRLLRRDCGTNPLYPQGGTWIYNRANWCPGSMVFADEYDFPIAPDSRHTVDMKMEPYINHKHPTANYDIHSYLFYYKSPSAANDVSVEEIITPNNTDEYSRENPICGDPHIIIKNNGSNVLTSVVIKYGILGELQQSYTWTGALASQKITDVNLPGLLALKEGEQEFDVTLESPNGHADEYPADNTFSSDVLVPPVYGTDMILVTKTNNDTTQDFYQLEDYTGKLIRERKLGEMTPNTIYRDTLHLSPGCYQFVFTDTAGDGLDFWANPEGGYGYVRLLDINGQLIKSFLSDFGSEIRHSFTVMEGAHTLAPANGLPLVNPSPIRNPGKFSLELFNNSPQNTSVKIVTEDSSKTVFEKTYPDLKEDIVPIDITASPDGYYYVKVTAGDRTVEKKIKVKHK